jgi:hypothetical protein
MSAPVDAAYRLPVGHDNSRGKKVNIHKRFWLSTLVFFRLARRTKQMAASRRGVRPGAAFYLPAFVCAAVSKASRSRFNGLYRSL